MIRGVITIKDAESMNNVVKSEDLSASASELKVYNRLGLTVHSTGAVSAEDVERIENLYTVKPDTYLSRLLKYIPTEIIALYLTIRPLFATGGNNYIVLHWCFFFFGIIITPIYLKRMQNVNKISQLLISTFAFAVWVFAIGGPFTSVDWYQKNQIYPALMVPLYTFLIPLLEAKK